MSTLIEMSELFCELVYRSYRIIKSHRRHFLALTGLFLFPLYLCQIICPRLEDAILEPNSTFHHQHIISSLTSTSPNLNESQILIPLLFSLFAFCLRLCAVGTITYSTLHAFNGEPPQIGSSLKSLLNSFFRLCSTRIVSKVMEFVVLVAVAIFLVLVCYLRGWKIDHQDSKNVSLLISAGVVGAWVVWLRLNWRLGLVVAVAEESKWGCEALRRSAYLMKGMRTVTLLVMLIYWVLSGWLENWESLYLGAAAVGGGVRWWKMVALVLEAGLKAVLKLHFLAANAVLYMRGKALRGEVEESAAGEYVSLPLP